MVRPALLAAALAGLAAASPAPAPQQIDLDAILNAPAPSITVAPVGASGQSTLAYDSAAAATTASLDASTAATASITGSSASAAATESPSTAVQKRTACQPEPSGSGPSVTPDTPAAFENYPPFHAAADAGVAPPPYVQTFQDLNASTQANSYLTYYVLKSYNVSDCAAHCDKVKGCTAFNIYFERDPSVDPGQGCDNPPSTTNIKCALWGSNIDKSSATNYGQYRDNFHVVIAGSNGYDKTNNTTPAPVPGFTISANLTGSAISLGGSFYITSAFFPGPFDPAVCGTFALAQASINKATAQALGLHSYTPVNMFNAYTVFLAGVAQGTYCALFDTNLEASWATFSGVWTGSGYVGVQNSWTYVLTVQDNGSC